MKIGICQMTVTKNKNENLLKAKILINKCIKSGAELIVLPECFNSPYGIKYFIKYAEVLAPNNPTFDFLEKFSQINPFVYIVAGSIPTYHSGKYYNTCSVWYQGKIISIYNKIHLYEINLEEHQFSEKKVLTCGNTPAIFKTNWGCIGLGICYDLRFPELAEYYRQHNCSIIIYPGAFNIYTGEKYWELLQKSRALDNMAFIISCSSARDELSDYVAWGYSTIL